MEVVWGELLAEFVGCSAIQTRGIYDGLMRENGKLDDEVLDTLELWCGWGSSIAIETVSDINKIKLCVFHHVY